MSLLPVEKTIIGLQIDYDVCSNYGNWNYSAGIGNDPRQDRKFNMIKQALDYDADVCVGYAKVNNANDSLLNFNFFQRANLLDSGYQNWSIFIKPVFMLPGNYVKANYVKLN